jgi:hypothetical protein
VWKIKLELNLIVETCLSLLFTCLLSDIISLFSGEVGNPAHLMRGKFVLDVILYITEHLFQF